MRKLISDLQAEEYIRLGWGIIIWRIFTRIIPLYLAASWTSEGLVWLLLGGWLICHYWFWCTLWKSNLYPWRGTILIPKARPDDLGCHDDRVCKDRSAINSTFQEDLSRVSYEIAEPYLDEHTAQRWSDPVRIGSDQLSRIQKERHNHYDFCLFDRYDHKFWLVTLLKATGTWSLSCCCCAKTILSFTRCRVSYSYFTETDTPEGAGWFIFTLVPKPQRICSSNVNGEIFDMGKKRANIYRQPTHERRVRGCRMVGYRGWSGARKTKSTAVPS